jgi:outer membrane protein TolC
VTRAGRAALLAVVAAAAPAVAAPQKLTLAQLIDKARAHAKQVQLAEAEVDVRRAQKREALHLWAPTGELRYLFTGAPSIQCQGAAVNGFGANGQPLASATYDPNSPSTRVHDCSATTNGQGQAVTIPNLTSIAGPAMVLELNLVQPIFTFGKIEAAVAAAGHGVAAGEAQVQAAREEVDVLAARAYWGL